MATRKRPKRPAATQLRRVTITRQSDGAWDVVRERATTGETIGCASLEDAFDAVRCIYDQDGKLKVEA